jgi:hypothetical protein
VIGQTLAMEGMFAFFLESAFIGDYPQPDVFATWLLPHLLRFTRGNLRLLLNGEKSSGPIISSMFC